MRLLDLGLHPRHILGSRAFARADGSVGREERRDIETALAAELISTAEARWLSEGRIGELDAMPLGVVIATINRVLGHLGAESLVPRRDGLLHDTNGGDDGDVDVADAVAGVAMVAVVADAIEENGATIESADDLSGDAAWGDDAGVGSDGDGDGDG